MPKIYVFLQNPKPLPLLRSLTSPSPHLKPPLGVGTPSQATCSRSPGFPLVTGALCPLREHVGLRVSLPGPASSSSHDVVLVLVPVPRQVPPRPRAPPPHPRTDLHPAAAGTQHTTRTPSSSYVVMLRGEKSTETQEKYLHKNTPRLPPDVRGRVAPGSQRTLSSCGQWGRCPGLYTAGDARTSVTAGSRSRGHQEKPRASRHNRRERSHQGGGTQTPCPPLGHTDSLRLSYATKSQPVPGKSGPGCSGATSRVCAGRVGLLGQERPRGASARCPSCPSGRRSLQGNRR